MAKPPFMLGVAVGLDEIRPIDIERMHAAGIRWLRTGSFGFDREAFLAGRPQGEKFAARKERVRALRAEGFQIMGLTPGPVGMPERAGQAGSEEFNRNYGRICAFFAAEYAGLIDWWQVANELDIWIFRGTLSMDECVAFLKAGIVAMKERVPTVKLGINITLFPSLPGEVDGNTEAHEGLALAKGIYQDPAVPVDFAGFDSYPGTWRAGGPESWHEYLDGFHALTGKPIVIQEFGYASAGGMMDEAESRGGLFPCQLKKWRFAWRGAHTPEIQADFAKESLRIFAEKPYVLGATYFKWQDDQRCWQCGESDCPAETAWGLMDRAGEPKPSYAALKETAARLFAT